MNKDVLKKAANRIGENVELNGLMRKDGRLKFRSVSQAKDIVGFDYIVNWDGGCYQFYAANPPLIGLTEPEPVICPVGLAIFWEYKIDYKEAVKLFQQGDWGESFTSIVLSKPMVHPEPSEPYWHFQSILGVEITIGADSGKVIYPK